MRAHAPTSGARIFDVQEEEDGDQCGTREGQINVEGQVPVSDGEHTNDDGADDPTQPCEREHDA